MPEEAFNKEAFFHDIVLRIQASGALQPFTTPKEPSADPSDFQKMPVTHIGVEPYRQLSQQLIWNNERGLTQNDMSLKSASIRKAISIYMPEDAFATYLAYFSSHLHLPFYANALRDSLEEIRRQTRILPYDKVIEDMQPYINQSDGEDNVREHLYKGAYMKRLTLYPQLATACAVFHAAHHMYIKELRNAFAGASDISIDESALAQGVLNTASFSQFHHFMLFSTVLPLAIHYYEQAPEDDACPHVADTRIAGRAQSQQRWNAPVNNERMRHAITKAWDTLFEKKMLVRDFPEQLPEAQILDGKIVVVDGTIQTIPAAPATQMHCPARDHLRKTSKAETLERLYDRAVQQPAWNALTITKNYLEGQERPIRRA